MTVTTTTWPTGASLVTWIGGVGHLTDQALTQIEDVMATATATIVERIDVRLLPDDDSCPRAVGQAIVLEGARLLSRRDSPQGVVAFAEFAARVARVDVDIEALLAAWRVGPEA